MPEMDDDVLEGMAEVLARMNSSQRKKLEVLLSAKAKGIKKTKRVEKLSFETVGKDGNLSEYEEHTGLDRDGAITHKEITKMKLFDCGHPASKEDFGHRAECGHVICKNCVMGFSLMCAYPGCMKKLCSVPGCYLKVADGVSFCNLHGRFAKFYVFCRNIGI